MADFYQMQADVVPATTTQPPAKTIFLVVAFNRAVGWSVRRASKSEEYLTREAAEQAAKRLPDHWSNVTIVEISLPAKNHIAVVPNSELAAKDELIRQLSERVAICSELLAKRAERHRDPR